MEHVKTVCLPFHLASELTTMLHCLMTYLAISFELLSLTSFDVISFCYSFHPPNEGCKLEC